MTNPSQATPRPRSLTLGPVLAALALCGFGLIASQTTSPSALTEFDQTVANRLHEDALASTGTVAVFKGFTTLGDHPVVLLLAAGVLMALVVRGQYGLAIVLVLVIAGGELLNLGTKHAFLRERPQFVDPVVPRPPSPSFPSGHAMGALISYGFLMYLLCLAVPERRWKRSLVGAVAVVGLVFAIGYFVPSRHRGYEGRFPEAWEIAYGLLAYGLLLASVPSWGRTALLGGLSLVILGVGSSRVYLGAHWFSDVVGGFLAGIVWLAAWLAAINYIQLRAARRHTLLKEQEIKNTMAPA